WDCILPGWSGFIAPYGGEYLLACTNGILKTRQILATVPDAVITQDGSDGQNIKFHVAPLETVAELLRSKKRRPGSQGERARLAELSLRHSPFRSISSSTAGGSAEGMEPQSGSEST